MRSCPRCRGLWRNPDFIKLWVGETISLFGAQVAALALPLTAAITLKATPAQMGYLGAARFAPFLFVTLFAGVWVDRRRRRPVLIGSNLGRAVLIGVIPLIAVVGRLRMEHLYLVSLLVGVLQVFFELAYQSYLPALVERGQLIDGNSKLLASASAADIGGPGLAGMLVQLITAPIALLANTFSFLASALTLAAIRQSEPVPSVQGQRGLWRHIASGFRIVLGSPYLRPIAFEAATYNLFSQVTGTVLILYATRQLGMGPGLLGLIIATGSIGSLLGSLAAGYSASRFGLGPAIVGSMTLGCIAPAAIPFAGQPGAASVALLIGGYFVAGFGATIANIHVVSLRQAIVPDRMLGRMNAAYRFLVAGATPLGSLLGGFLGEVVGLRLTLIVGAVGVVLALMFISFSRVPRLQSLPRMEDAETAAHANAPPRAI